MPITLEDVNVAFTRSVMASQVTLPIEEWVQYLNLAQFALTHGSEDHQAEIARLTAERDARDRAKVAEGMRMALNLMDAALSQPQIGSARDIVRDAILSRAKDMEAGNG